MASTSSKDLLWVDDNITEYSPFYSKIAEMGFTLDCCESIDAAKELLSEFSYKVVFLDAMLGPSSSIDSVKQLLGKNRPNIFVVSGFLYLNRLHGQIAEIEEDLGIEIPRVDKTSMPFPDEEEEFEKFFRELLTISPHQKKSEHMKVFDQAKQAALEDYPTWDDYLNLDISEKISLLNIARDRTQETKEALFADGYVYVLFCGDWSEPIYKVRERSKILTEEQVVNEAKKAGSAPFPFSKGGRAEDFSGCCSEKTRLRGYPLLDVAYKTNSQRIHFDTGNPTTLVSYEWYQSQGWLPRSLIVESYDAGADSWPGRNFTWTNASILDATGDGETGDVKGFAVFDWIDNRLATRCADDCEIFQSRVALNGHCRYRTGLLGRNLLVDLGKELRVNCRTGRSYLMEEQE